MTQQFWRRRFCTLPSAPPRVETLFLFTNAQFCKDTYRYDPFLHYVITAEKGEQSCQGEKSDMIICNCGEVGGREEVSLALRHSLEVEMKGRGEADETWQ